MRLIGKTNKQRFEALFKKNYQSLFYCAFDIVADEEAAKDIVSDIFTELWEDFANKQKENMDAYLNRTVRNRAIDFLRHQTVKRRYEELFLQEEQSWEETEDEQEEKIQRIYTIMDSLTPKTREVLELSYFKGKKYQEVADELHMSVSAVHKHIVQAFSTFRKDFLGNKK